MLISSLRVLCFLATLTGFGTLGAMRWKPDWIFELDRVLVERHMQVREQVLPILQDKAVTPAERLQKLEPIFRDLSWLQTGDRLYPLWVRMGSQIAQDAITTGRPALASQFLEGMLEKQPRQLDWRLRLVNALSQVGEGQDVAKAQEHLDWVRKFFPDWTTAWQTQLELYGRAGDWDALAQGILKTLRPETPIVLPTADALRGVREAAWRARPDGVLATVGQAASPTIRDESVVRFLDLSYAVDGSNEWVQKLIVRYPMVIPALQRRGVVCSGGLESAAANGLR